jgi:hypothetical protein
MEAGEPFHVPSPSSRPPPNATEHTALGGFQSSQPAAVLHGVTNLLLFIMY